MLINKKKADQKIGIFLGGENRIRTCETVARLHAFQACAFNHSATSPYLNLPPHYTSLHTTVIIHNILQTVMVAEVRVFAL